MKEPLSNAPTEPGEARPIGGPANLEPGMILADTYEVEHPIGHGGMGEVWVAKHLRLPGRRVVIKVLRYGASDPVALARFRREAEIGSRLGHPNIVQVLDFNTLPAGAPYLVLELLEGETLASRLYRGRMPLADASGIVVQIGSALAAAHREGIVHRDLKPDNVFLCQAYVGGELRDLVKVLDFGISKMRGSITVLTQDSALIGTPQYMAPEQATGNNSEIDARTDIFAFGAIVFEMLTGRPPFTGDSLASVIHAVVYAPSPSLRDYVPDAPERLVRAIERALAKDREARFPDVASFVREVTGAPAGGAATTPPPNAAGAEIGYGATVMLESGTPSGNPTAPQRLQPAPGPVGGTPTDRVPPPRRSSAAPWIAVAVVCVAGAAGFFLWKKGQATVSPPPVMAQPPPPTRPATPPPGQPPPAHAAERPPETHEQPAAATHVKAAPSDKAIHRRPLAPEAAADLEQAEAALAAGNSAEALRLAQHSLYAERSSRAYEVMARARCAQGDLGNAKAAFAHVDAADRAAVLRDCRKHEIELR
jgi:serine/threonine-protein kinase